MGLSPEVINLFMEYHWPGNIRELKSALEYSYATGAAGLLEVSDLPPHLQPKATSDESKRQYAPPVSNRNDLSEKRALIEALRKTGGNQSQAAQLLGVHRMTVFNRIRKYGISLKVIS